MIYITLHCIALHFTTLHYIALHCTTLHYITCSTQIKSGNSIQEPTEGLYRLRGPTPTGVNSCQMQCLELHMWVEGTRGPLALHAQVSNGLCST
jgi:hypothetical protein